MSIRQGNKVIAGHINYHPDLFDHKWADHILNDVSWLRADTFSWQDGGVYQAAYNHLVADYDDNRLYAWYNSAGEYDLYTKVRNPEVGTRLYYQDGIPTSYTVQSVTTSHGYVEGVSFMAGQSEIDCFRQVNHDLWIPQTEVVAGVTVTYYLGADGHKIVLPDQESNVAAIYTATGVAWYYILDTTNERFKLPRAKHNKYNDKNIPVFGNGEVLGLTDGNGGNRVIGAYVWNSGYRNGMGLAGSVTNRVMPTSASDDRTSFGPLGVDPDYTKSGLVAQAQSQDTDQYKYLYFYIGNFTQTALENTAGLNAELFNGKVDTGHQVIAFQAPTAGNNYTWYRKYADGWVEQGGTVGQQGSSGTISINIPVEMANTYYTLTSGVVLSDNGSTDHREGANEYISKSTTSFEKYMWSKWTSFWWKIEGMAA